MKDELGGAGLGVVFLGGIEPGSRAWVHDEIHRLLDTIEMRWGFEDIYMSVDCVSADEVAAWAKHAPDSAIKRLHLVLDNDEITSLAEYAYSNCDTVECMGHYTNDPEKKLLMYSRVAHLADHMMIVWDGSRYYRHFIDACVKLKRTVVVCEWKAMKSVRKVR